MNSTKYLIINFRIFHNRPGSTEIDFELFSNESLFFIECNAVSVRPENVRTRIALAEDMRFSCCLFFFYVSRLTRSAKIKFDNKRKRQTKSFLLRNMREEGADAEGPSECVMSQQSRYRYRSPSIFVTL